jgi:hypothetical protein
MKKMMLCSIIMIASFISTITAKEVGIRDEKVPQIVQNEFRNKYHDAIVKKWMVNNSTYKVIYKLNSKECKSSFDADGKWLRTTSVINWENLPEAVKAGLRKTAYKDWTIYGLLQIDYFNGTKNYALLVDNANQYTTEDQDGFKEIYKVYFSPHGKLVTNKIQYNYNLI